MKLNVYGKRIEAVKTDNGWKVFYLGEGLKRLANDLVIPKSISEDEVIPYLADLCHEWATAKNSQVVGLR